MICSVGVMAEIKCRGVVLHTIKYNDDALLSHVFTEAEGCVSFMVRISRSPRAAVRHTLFQPMALLELSWQGRPSGGVCKLKSAQVSEALTSVPYDPHKTAIAMFLAEFLHHALRNEPKSSQLFEFVFQSVQWLDASPHSFANFHLVFLLRLSRFLGFYPEISSTEVHGYFDLQSCCFTSVRPSHHDFLSPEDALLLPLLVRMRYENMRFFRFSGVERNRFLTLLNRFYSLHLPNFPELRSLAVLRDVFG